MSHPHRQPASRLRRRARAAVFATLFLLPIAASGCGGDGATTPGNPTGGDPTADRLEITFAYSTGPSQSIESMDIFQSAKDGRLAAPFIATSDVELLPAWSRDGTRLLFTRDKLIPLGTVSNFVASLWIANADGSGARQLVIDQSSSTGPFPGSLYFNNQTNGAWSPDGTSIAFRRLLGSTGEDGIAIIGADGTGLRWLIQGGDFPSWSVDGRIAFGMSGAIWTINPDGTALKQLTPTGLYAVPKWSRDGTRLVYIKGSANSSGTAYDIVVTRADGTDPRTLVTGGNNLNPSWSPDGQFILYEHLELGEPAGPKCTLLKVPSSGGASVLLTPNRGVGYCGGAAWRPY